MNPGKESYDLGFKAGATAGKKAGRAKAHREVADLCTRIIESLPKYEDPRLVQQIKGYCQGKLGETEDG